MEKHYSVTQPIYNQSSLNIRPFRNGNPEKVYTSPSTIKPYQNGNPGKVYTSPSTIKPYQNGNPEKVYTSPSTIKPYQNGNTEKTYNSPSNIKPYQNGNPEKIYHSPSITKPFQNGNPEKIYNSPSVIEPYQDSRGPEQIYSDPEVVTNRNRHNEKDAVRYIMEKYDSLRCLDGQFEGLQVSSDSGDSVQKVPIDDDDDEEEEDDQRDEAESPELTEADIAQVEVFFRSHKTHVSVCQCLANLYFAAAETASGERAWELARTGIPVLLLDKGETRARDKRMLQVALAERGSGFVLWKDVIDNLSNYRAEEGRTFHTMYLSSDHRRMAGLSFDNPEAAGRFLEEVERLTADPLNICLSVPKQKKKQKAPKKKEKVKQPRKCDISSPCCFQHVTNVALNDKKKLFSMATLVPTGGRG